MIKKIFKIITIIFSVLIGAVLGIILVFVDWPTLIKVKIYGRCPSETIDNVRAIDFLGYKLSVPDKLVTECFAYTTPDLGGYDPATVTLDAKLPDFTPLEGIEWPKIYKSDDQIRIAISGYEIEDKHDGVNDFSLSKSFENDISRKNRKNGEPIYSKSNKMSYGFEHYISNKSVPIYSGDFYVAKDEKGNIDFYLQCFENKEKHHRYWNCDSNDFILKSGISYRYYYNSQHLPDARKIDQKIKEMIKAE